ncbi:acyl carrier protein [Bacillus thuringiensis]|uniref:acyl carrier protein n=1 Tax=Bacillus tropicus TaxID=2026188 RepID=UPI0035DB14C2
MQVKIRTFITENMNSRYEEADFIDSDNFFELGYVNSLFAMKLVTFIESEFNIELDVEDIDINNFSSVDNIVELINKKKKDN